MGQAPRRRVRSGAGGRALHRHRHLAAQPGRAARGWSRTIWPSCGPSKRRSSTRPRDWFATAGGWSTLPARCSSRRTRRRWTPSSPPIRRSRSCRWRGPGRSPRRRPARALPCPDPAPAPYRRVLRGRFGARRVIAVRRARPADAVAIGAVHVAAWRSAYPGILPDKFLSRLSVARQAAYYDSAIRARRRRPCRHRLRRRSRRGRQGGRRAGDRLRQRRAGAQPPWRAAAAPGHWPTARSRRLYVLDDFRDRGLGRHLLRAASEHLSAAGCGSVFVWVLRDNPSRWFY